MLEILDGLGDLYRGDALIARVRYRVEVSVSVLDAGNDEINGLKHVEGSASPPPDTPWLFLQLMTQDVEKMRLRLADGRWFDCYLQNSDGHLVNRGQKGLYREQA